MKNPRNTIGQSHLTSNTFLENVMPQIKINQKTFTLDGIDPVSSNKEIDYTITQTISSQSKK